MKLFFMEYRYVEGDGFTRCAISMATCELMARAELYNSIGDMDVIHIIACEETKHKVWLV